MILPHLPCGFLVTLLIFFPFFSFSQQGSKGNPVGMGTYGGGSFSFSDVRSTAGHGNGYDGGGDPYYGQGSATLVAFSIDFIVFFAAVP